MEQEQEAEPLEPFEGCEEEALEDESGWHLISVLLFTPKVKFGFL